MLYNYFKIAFRNLLKYKLFSFINIFGLASGMMICLLVLVDIKGSFDYDTFHPYPERTYRILTDVKTQDNNVMAFASSPMPMGDALKNNYSFVEGSTRVVRVYAEIGDGRKRLQPLTYWVDADFFKLFNFPLISGKAATEPFTAVLTQEMATNFFGTANPIGKTLHYDGVGSFIVTGIINKNVGASHLRFDLLLSLNGQHFEKLTHWSNYQGGYNYVLLKEKTSPVTFEKALASISAQATKLISGKTQINGYQFRAQTLADLAPAREDLLMGTYEPTVGKLAVEIGIGLLTLLLAAFNYINLTLARSLSRAREVGIRKVSGAVRWQLMGQFMAESVILSLLSLVLSFVFLKLIEPMAFVQRWLIGGIEWGDEMIFIFVTFSIVAGALAGILPARILSGFEPAQVLRSSTGLKIIRGISLRKTLIVVQFSISLFALIALYVTDRQQNYMATGDYGFERTHILNIPITTDQPYQRLANVLLQKAGVESVAATSELFGVHGDENLWLHRDHAKNDSVVADRFSIDHQLIPTLKLSLLAGKNLPENASDRLIVINEEAVKALQIKNPREAIGKAVWLNDTTEAQIVGVVKNFRYATFKWAIRPMIFHYQPAKFRYLSVKIDPNSTTTLAAIQEEWKRLYPYEPFKGEWYDRFLYDRHSHLEDTSFMSVLIAIAISIACLGLLGMVTYHIETRNKEVGIRKIMGATISRIVWTLSRDFALLLLIACIIALPLGYVAGTNILNHYAYHISIGIDILGICVGLLALIGGLTIGIQTYRSAIANPIKALRSE